jgi:trehalose utilization protein
MLVPIPLSYGVALRLGAGRVFSFRPGHETFPVSKEKPLLQVLENAVRWLAARRE